MELVSRLYGGAHLLHSANETLFSGGYVNLFGASV